MKFNDIWTKEDNDQLRRFIKERKNVDFIKNFFGDRINHHPRKKYATGGSIPDFSKFNEIICTPQYTDYTIKPIKSKHFKNEIDYHISFNTNSNNIYIFDLICYYDVIGPFNNQRLYNISFTIEDQHNLDNSEEYEKITNNQEEIEIIKRLIYIFNDVYQQILKYKTNVFVIGETNDPRKINFYRNVIKDSYDIEEIIGESSINQGKKVSYFKII